MRSVLSVWYKTLCGMSFSENGEKVQFGFCTLSYGWLLNCNRFAYLDTFDSLDRIKIEDGICTVTSLKIRGNNCFHLVLRCEQWKEQIKVFLLWLVRVRWGMFKSL